MPTVTKVVVADDWPVPERAICWVAPLTFRALSVSVSVPVRAPDAVGVKSTPTTQEVPSVSWVDVVQVVAPLSMVKFVPGCVLATAMPVRFSVVLPLPIF